MILPRVFLSCFPVFSIVFVLLLRALSVLFSFFLLPSLFPVLLSPSRPSGTSRAQALDVEDLETVVDAFQEVAVKKGTVIIRQGDDGDRLYLIESGQVDVMKTFPGENGDKFLCKMGPGDAFGELALMYNAPRAATVIAADDMELWALDRDSFTNIVRDAAAKKREIFEESLKEVSEKEEAETWGKKKEAKTRDRSQSCPEDVSPVRWWRSRRRRRRGGGSPRPHRRDLALLSLPQCN